MTQRSWVTKFRDAFRGIAWGVGENKSFCVHFLLTAAVVALAAALRVSRLEWCVLLICVTVVLAAELLNSAIEDLAREVDSDVNPGVGRALDVASGAVLVAAIGAAIVGVILFWPHLMVLV